MIIILKVFLRLLDSLEIIFILETSSALQPKFKQLSSVCLFTFIRRDFLPRDGDQTFNLFIANAQNEQGHLIFVHWKLA